MLPLAARPIGWWEHLWHELSPTKRQISDYNVLTWLNNLLNWIVNNRLWGIPLARLWPCALSCVVSFVTSEAVSILLNCSWWAAHKMPCFVPLTSSQHLLHSGTGSNINPYYTMKKDATEFKNTALWSRYIFHATWYISFGINIIFCGKAFSTV